VSRADKTLQQVLSGTADANVDFGDLCRLLTHLGFEERIRGSHHLFRKGGIVEMVNLQRDGSQAKPYQVRQVRNLILEYRLTES